MTSDEALAAKGIAAAFVLIIGIVFGTMACQTVDAGSRGVKVTFGEVESQVFEEGLHFKWPWVTIHEVNVRQTLNTQEVTAASSDLQTVFTEVAVSYRPKYDMVPELFKTVGPTKEQWESVLIDPAINEIAKAVTAKFTAEDLIKRRADAKFAITEVITERMAEFGLVVIDVSIKNFRFGKAFEQAIESKQVAEQNAQKATNELEKARIDAQQAVARAEANKSARILAAEAQSAEIRIQSEADAVRIKLLADAEAFAHKSLGQAVNDKSLRVRFLERWDGVLPRVVTDGNGVLLQLGLGDKPRQGSDD